MQEISNGNQMHPIKIKNNQTLIIEDKHKE